jgi:hypothetical protein
MMTQKEDFARLFRHRRSGTMIWTRKHGPKTTFMMTQKEDFARLFRHRRSGTMIKNQIYHEIMLVCLDTAAPEL